MKINKKAISPVVATALLLVVAVVAVVGFQTWFNTYQSGITAQVEKDSKTGVPVLVERLETGRIFLNNKGSENITVEDVSIGGTTDCVMITDELEPGVNTWDLDGAGNCGNSLTVGETGSIVVVTETGGVFSSTQIVRE